MFWFKPYELSNILSETVYIILDKSKIHYIHYNILDLREKKMKTSVIYSISKWYQKWLKRMSEMQIVCGKQTFPKLVKTLSETSVHQGCVVAHTFILCLNAFPFVKLSYNFKFLVPNNDKISIMKRLFKSALNISLIDILPFN